MGWIAGLLLLWLFGVWLRGAAYTALDYPPDDSPFFLESAQHYRNVKLVAEGGGIPRIDVALEYPEGLPTRSHTLLGETLLGHAWRVLRVEQVVRFARTHGVGGIYLSDLLRPFLPSGADLMHAYVRLGVRVSMAFVALLIFFLVHAACGSRPAGFLAAAIYTVAYAALERATGWEFFHEHTAFPFLALHLVFAVRALKSGGWRDALLSAVCVLLALLCWKVIQFYLLAMVGYFVLGFLLNRWGAGDRRILAALVLVLVPASLLFENHLRYGRFWFSKPMLVCYALLLASWWLRKRPAMPSLGRLALLGGLLLAALGLVEALGRVAPADSYLHPASVRYGHVWETFFAILRHGGEKPADPAVLSFDARHYWGAPNTPPTLLRAASLYVLLLPLAFGPSAVLLHRYRWGRIESMPMLRERGYWFLLYLTLVFTGFYLLLYKMTSFLSLFAAALAGAGAATFLRGSLLRRIAVLIPIAAFLAVSVRQDLAPQRFFLTRILVDAGFETSPDKRYQNVLLPDAMPALMHWIAAETRPGDAFLCEFVLSPTILVYGDRPVNQNPFFESEMREKYRLLAEGLFQSEEAFHALCRRWRTTYFIYNAHMLLRDDPWMSFRYISNNMDWSEDWAAYRFHFRPQELRLFELAHQNSCFRVYRVLDPEAPEPEASAHAAADAAPTLFNESLFRSLVETGEDGIPRSGAWFRRILGTDR